MPVLSSVSILGVVALLANLHLSIAQFGTVFPFNMVPGGLRIPFIGGGYAQPAAGGIIGQGLGFAGQQNQGWNAPAPVVQQPVGWQAPAPVAPRPVGWNAQPVIQPQPVGWNAQPIQRPIAQPVGWNAQPVVQQPVGWNAQPIVQQQPVGWGVQPVAPQHVAQNIGWNVKPAPVVQSGWGSSAQVPQVVPQSQTVSNAIPATNIPTAPLSAPSTNAVAAPLTTQPVQVPTFPASPAIATSGNAAYSK